MATETELLEQRLSKEPIEKFEEFMEEWTQPQAPHARTYLRVIKDKLGKDDAVDERVARILATSAGNNREDPLFIGLGTHALTRV